LVRDGDPVRIDCVARTIDLRSATPSLPRAVPRMCAPRPSGLAGVLEKYGAGSSARRAKAP